MGNGPATPSDAARLEYGVLGPVEVRRNGHPPLGGSRPRGLLAYNAEEVPEAVARFGEDLGAAEPAARVEERARLGGFAGLRDFRVAEAELPEVAAAAVERPSPKANPPRATAADIERLLRSIW